jgi:hypothetical protein
VTAIGEEVTWAILTAAALLFPSMVSTPAANAKQAAPAGEGAKPRPLPAAALPNHGLPKGHRPPVVPPTVDTESPARKAAMPRADYAIRGKLEEFYTAKDSKTVILRK